jgi:hypothetical protein
MSMSLIAVVATLLSGGLAGAILTIVSISFRSRKQPVFFDYEVVPVFKRNMLGESNVRAVLTLSSEVGGTGQDVPSLFVVKLQIVNRGNSDLESFEFGITLSEKEWAVHCDIQSPDRHHVGRVVNVLGPAAPTSEIDFCLKPFNRRDAYLFSIYVVGAEDKVSLNELTLSSKNPVAFRRMSRLPDTLLHYVLGLASVSIYSMSLQFGHPGTQKNRKQLEH